MENKWRKVLVSIPTSTEWKAFKVKTPQEMENYLKGYACNQWKWETSDIRVSSISISYKEFWNDKYALCILDDVAGKLPLNHTASKDINFMGILYGCVILCHPTECNESGLVENLLSLDVAPQDIPKLAKNQEERMEQRRQERLLELRRRKLGDRIIRLEVPSFQ